MLALLVVAGATGLHVAWTVLGVGGPRGTQAFTDLAELAGALAAAVACALRAGRERGGDRLGWGLLAGASLSWAAGEAIWSVFELGLGREVPFPSLADVGFLGTAPLAVAGVLALSPGSAAPKVRAAVDGVIVAGSLLFVSWALLLGPLYREAGTGVLERAIGLAYPASDIALASAALLVAARLRRSRPALGFVIAGLLALAVADSGFAYLTVNGAYSNGSITDAGWLAGFLLIAAGAAAPPTRSEAVAARAGREILIPYLPVAMAVAAAVAGGPRMVADGVLFWSGVAVVALVLGRQVLALVENGRLTRELEGRAADLERANAELRSADEVKTSFLAIASHELRTPLTSIVGFATTMRIHWERIGDEEKLREVEAIERQARRLSRLAGDLLTMSCIEAGALEVRPDSFEASQAIRHALGELGPQVEAVRVICPAGLRVVADRDHVQQMLVNYLGNALKYGRRPITIEARAEDEWVELRVRDCGPGVPEDFRPRLFQRFAQAGTDTTRRGEGTGLGLSIVRGLARAQRGDAWYEANEPFGACFAVRLPRARERSRAPTAPAGVACGVAAEAGCGAGAEAAGASAERPGTLTA